MKYIIVIALLFSMYIPTKAIAGQLNPVAGQPQSCPVSSAETLVCSVVICNPIGLAIAKSRSECLTVNRKFAIYLATLGFWSKPPSCKSRDKNCNKTGKASKAQISTSECSQLSTSYEQESCRAAITGQVTKSFCNKLSGYRKTQCLAKIPPPPVPIDCGAKYRPSVHVDVLAQCMNNCSRNRNSCVVKHSEVDCSKITNKGSLFEKKCNLECSRWNLCSTDFTKGFNADFTNDFEKQFKQ